MFSLESSRYSALEGYILLRRIRCRKLATNSETTTQVHEHTLGALRVVGSPERTWNPHICHEAFADRKKGGRAFFTRAVRPLEMRSAVNENNDLPLPPERHRIRFSGVDVNKPR